MLFLFVESFVLRKNTEHISLSRQGSTTQGEEVALKHLIESLQFTEVGYISPILGIEAD